jgi:hypothetical protein
MQPTGVEPTTPATPVPDHDLTSATTHEITSEIRATETWSSPSELQTPETFATHATYVTHVTHATHAPRILATHAPRILATLASALSTANIRLWIAAVTETNVQGTPEIRIPMGQYHLPKMTGKHICRTRKKVSVVRWTDSEEAPITRLPSAPTATRPRVRTALPAIESRVLLPDVESTLCWTEPLSPPAEFVSLSSTVTPANSGLQAKADGTT